MKLSAGQGARNRPWRDIVVGVVTLLTVAGSLALPAPALARKSADWFWGDVFGHPSRPHRIRHAARVPLPKPRPPEAPRAKPAEEARGEPEIPPAIHAPAPAPSPPAAVRQREAKQLEAKQPEPKQPEPKQPEAKQPEAKQPETKPAEQAAAPAPPQPSACRQALTGDIADAPSIAPLQGPGGCGGDDLVRLEAIILPDKRRVRVTPAATLRCPMATAIADWVRTDIARLAQQLGSEPVELDELDSYDCRNFNGVKGAPLSEHGLADALDVGGFKLANGREITLTDRNVPRAFREDVLHSACTRFTTVLGPDSDWHHENHIHLDLRQRHHDYKICEWDVLDPLPRIAPLLPPERPTEAPPREVAKQSEGKEAGPAAAKQEEAKPAAADAGKPGAKHEAASKVHRATKVGRRAKRE